MQFQRRSDVVLPSFMAKQLQPPAGSFPRIQAHIGQFLAGGLRKRSHCRHSIDTIDIQRNRICLTPRPMVDRSYPRCQFRHRPLCSLLECRTCLSKSTRFDELMCAQRERAGQRCNAPLIAGCFTDRKAASGDIDCTVGGPDQPKSLSNFSAVFRMAEIGLL